MSNKQIIILGGGITGLSAAYYLEKAGFENIILLEAGSAAGGKIKTTKEDGYLVERGPDSFITSKPYAIDLINELGLENEIIDPLTHKFYILKNGELLTSPKGMMMMVPKVIPFLRSKLFSVKGKLRIIQEGWVKPHANPHEDESFGHFIERRFGKEMLTYYAEPLFGGIYATPSYELSMQAAFPQLRHMEARHFSITNAVRSMPVRKKGQRSPFVSLRDGMQTLPDAILKVLKHTEIKTNTKVEQLRLTSEKPEILLSDGSTISADEIISTLPASALRKLINDELPSIANDLSEFTVSSSQIVTLAYDKKMISEKIDSTGYVVPINQRVKVTACTFSSSKWKDRAPEGKALIRCFFTRNKEKMTEMDLITAAHSELKDILGIKGNPEKYWVDHWFEALPQYKLNHLKRVHDLREKLSSVLKLKVAGSWLEGVGIPDCILQGKTAADSVTKN